MKRVALFSISQGAPEYALESIASLAHQVDRVAIAVGPSQLEGFRASLPLNADVYEEVSIWELRRALKLPGKSAVFFASDTLSYPEDYVSVMTAHLQQVKTLPAMVGVAGTIYSDLYSDKTPGGRTFGPAEGLDSHVFVNQLSLSTLACLAQQLPETADIEPDFSEEQFAALCHQRGIHRVAVARAANWVQLVSSKLPEPRPRAPTFEEIREFSGFRRLPRLFVDRDAKSPS